METVDSFVSCFTNLVRWDWSNAQSRANCSHYRGKIFLSPKCLWMMRFSSLLVETGTVLNPVWAPVSVTSNPFWYLLHLPQVVCSHTYTDILSWFLRGASEDSKVLSVCGSFLSPELCLLRLSALYPQLRKSVGSSWFLPSYVFARKSLKTVRWDNNHRLTSFTFWCPDSWKPLFHIFFLFLSQMKAQICFLLLHLGQTWNF